MKENKKTIFGNIKQFIKDKKIFQSKWTIIGDAPDDKKEIPKYAWYSPKNIRFSTCMTIGIISNIFFFIFILICLYYYDMYQQFYQKILGFEIAGWVAEALGFLLMGFATIGIVVRVKYCTLTKVLMIIYLIAESVIMVLDFQLVWTAWYEANNKYFIIIHAILSALIFYSYSAFDPYSNWYKFFVILGSLICLCGMFWVIFGYKVYFSLLTNCGAYLMLFIATRIMIHLEEVQVECNGDPVIPIETKSVFFE